MGHVEKEVPVPHSQAWSVMDCVVDGCCGMQVVDVAAGIHAMSRINVSIRMMDVGRIVDLIGSMCEEILRSNSYIADSENYELCVLRVIEPRFTRLKDDSR